MDDNRKIEKESDNKQKPDFYEEPKVIHDPIRRYVGEETEPAE